ncbi:MAG: recombinase family protein [Candidatus Binatia bacterium]
MKAAIYARYSSDNQRPESIDDQVRSCRDLAQNRDCIVNPAHVYTDEAKSGSLRSRPGLEALCASARDHEFEAVIVDDLSRLSRDNHFLLTLYAELRFYGVRILSRADCLDSEDPHSKLGFQMRGIVNELYLDDLREKTLRGQLGQKSRGFTVGEATYGYRSEPVGEMRVDRRGRPRPDGYRMKIDAHEALVVRRIFQDFADGVAIRAIVATLNAEGVAGRRKVARGWSPSTISRILKNEKYIGHWTWNRTETRRDPRTGRKRRHPKAESDWHVTESEELRIVPQDGWDRALARWREVDRTWPIPRGQRSGEMRQRSYTETHPPHLLSGILRCAECGGAMGQVSGKSGGYYGCLAAPKSACRNKLLVPRRLAETKLIAAVRERIADADSLHHVLERVEAEVRKLCAHLPEDLKLKHASLAAEERRISNFIEFIGGGKGTPALGEALRAAEHRSEELRSDVAALQATTGSVFQVPPVEWVAERVRNLQELLEHETSRSALLLRGVLGPVRLTPISPEVGKPYYQAETTLQIVDLLHDPEGGSNWLRKWRRGELNTGARGTAVAQRKSVCGVTILRFPATTLPFLRDGHSVPTSFREQLATPVTALRAAKVGGRFRDLEAKAEARALLRRGR